MFRRFLFALIVISLALSAIAQNAPAAPTVVNEAGLKKVVPETYFFRGLSATTQLRNSAAIHYPDDYYVIIGLVDTSGYSSDIKAKYTGLFITEKKLRFDGGAMVISRPFSQMLPAVTSINPPIIRRMVVLPQPAGPINSVLVPRSSPPPTSASNSGMPLFAHCWRSLLAMCSAAISRGNTNTPPSLIR